MLVGLLKSVTTRKKNFKDHGISRLYTVNTKDFEEFTFLETKDPLEHE